MHSDVNVNSKGGMPWFSARGVFLDEDNMEALIALCEATANKNKWERDFVTQQRVTFNRFGPKTTFSEKQVGKLEAIAGLVPTNSS